MSHTPDRHGDPDRRFLERLAEQYRPEPPGPLESAHFDAVLRERIGRGGRATAWHPALLGATATLVLALWAWPAATPTPTPGSDAALVASAATSWETDVLLAGSDATLAEEDYLPDEYVVIAYAFLDGS